MSGIKLSPTHGVNPSVLYCPVCAESSGLALCGRLPGDEEAPRAMLDREPCEKCVGYMQRGIVLISVRDGESGDNPYRTGRLSVVTEEFMRRVVTPPELLESILQKRVTFLEDSVWDALGLPRTDDEARALGSEVVEKP